jgi:hypothetical protein
LELMMENLRRCTSRFLTKVTKVKHSAPTNDQLIDMIHKVCANVILRAILPYW